MTGARAVPPAPAEPAGSTRPTASTPEPGGHRSPAAATSTAAVGVPGCDWCGGAGRLLARPVVAGVVQVDTPPIWCRCAGRLQLVDEAFRAHVDRHGYPPVLDDLAAATGLNRSAVHRAVGRLQAAGVLARGGAGTGSARMLQLVHATEETRWPS